jgi:hypothetical protein
MPTNGKMEGQQLFRQFLAMMEAGRWVLEDTSAAIAVRSLIDNEPQTVYTSGVIDPGE